ncbi:MAG: extracellular solute-binding protein [Propionibacteriaceae bacterium]|nr:extracellular solute-binding protein [Propionibacteriaceae bacterium]
MRIYRRSARHVFIGVVAIAAALAVTACAPNPTPSVSPTSADEPTVGEREVTIRFSWWGNDDRAKRTLAAVEAFRAAYPKITVETESADFAPYFDKLGTQVAGGDAPDVFQINDNSLRTFVANGVLLDLATVSSTLGTSEIPDPVLDTGRIDGVLAGIPMGVSPWGVIIVNKALAEQSGVPLPDDKTWTWDDYTTTGARMAEALGDGYFGIDSFGFESFNLESWARDRGETIFNGDGTVGISAETLAAYWTYVLGLHDSGTSMPATEYIEAWNTGVSAYPVFTGKAVMAMAGTQWIERISTAAGTEMEIRRAPSESSASPNNAMFNKASMFWAISSKTEHPEEAALFVDWLTNSGVSYDHLGFDRGLPANQRVLTDLLDAGKLKPTDIAQVDFINAVASEVGFAYVPPPPGATALAGLMSGRYGELGALHRNRRRTRHRR